MENTVGQEQSLKITEYSQKKMEQERRQQERKAKSEHYLKKLKIKDDEDVRKTG